GRRRRGASLWPGSRTEVPGSRFQIPDAQRAFWSFQPVKTVALPSVRDTSWPQSKVDRFILAGLEAKGLTPSPPADRRTLLRRATFDLIGLPPTPAEIDAFLSDNSPGAFGRVIE